MENEYVSVGDLRSKLLDEFCDDEVSIRDSEGNEIEHWTMVVKKREEPK